MLRPTGRAGHAETLGFRRLEDIVEDRQQVLAEECWILRHWKVAHTLHNLEMNGIGEFGDFAAHLRCGGRVVFAAQQAFEFPAIKPSAQGGSSPKTMQLRYPCLLYTSDAAAEGLAEDL